MLLFPDLVEVKFELNKPAEGHSFSKYARRGRGEAKVYAMRTRGRGLEILVRTQQVPFCMYYEIF